MSGPARVPLSGRLPWRARPNPLARALAARRAAGGEVLDLTESNPTRVGLAAPPEALRDALAAGGSEGYAPEPRGLGVAREAVAAEYARRGVAVDAGALVLTASTSEAYAYLLKLLCDPGDAVLVPAPCYPLFEYLARLEGVRTRPYPLAPAGGRWAIDLEALARAAAAPRARAVIVVAPHNPLGSGLAPAEHARLQALCAHRRLALIADEVFADYAPAGDAARVPSALAAGTQALTCALGGLSKSCGLPQLKLAWIAVGGPPAAARAALAGLDLVADTYLSVATPVQRALPRLLALGARVRGRIAARLAANRALLARAVAGPAAVSSVPAEGAWSAVLRLPGTRSDEAWALRLLLDAGVLVHPGYFFDMPPGAWLVPSLLPEPDVVAEGLRRIVAAAAAG